MLAKVYVTPKKAILDPQGKAIAHSLHALDYAEVSEFAWASIWRSG